MPDESRSRLARLIEEGRVTVDGARPPAKRKVKSGEAVSVELAPRQEESAFQPEAIALDIVHEDDAIIVLDKPAGLVVHPGSGNWQGTLLNALLHHAPGLRRSRARASCIGSTRTRAAFSSSRRPRSRSSTSSASCRRAR